MVVAPGSRLKKKLVWPSADPQVASVLLSVPDKETELPVVFPERCRHSCEEEPEDMGWRIVYLRASRFLKRGQSYRVARHASADTHWNTHLHVFCCIS